LIINHALTRVGLYIGRVELNRLLEENARKAARCTLSPHTNIVSLYEGDPIGSLILACSHRGNVLNCLNRSAELGLVSEWPLPFWPFTSRAGMGLLESSSVE
jgi:hypothetical protein